MDIRGSRLWNENYKRPTYHRVYNRGRITDFNQGSYWPGDISYRNDRNQSHRLANITPEIDRENDSSQPPQRMSNVWNRSISTGSGYTLTTFPFRRVQRQRRRLALIFGNDNYSPPHQLHSCYQDAIDTELKLRCLGFQCTLVLNAGKHMMFEQERNFRAIIQSGDCILIYFSGHGMEDKVSKAIWKFDDLSRLICLGKKLFRVNRTWRCICRSSIRLFLSG